jgi:hypothetical protein
MVVAAARVAVAAGLTALLGLPSPAAAQPATAVACEVTAPLRIVAIQVYREGVFLVADAVVENVSVAPVLGVLATAEVYDFFGDLLRVAYGAVVPADLAGGHRATVRVVTPFSEAARTLAYRLAWRANGTPVQLAIRCVL